MKRVFSDFNSVISNTTVVKHRKSGQSDRPHIVNVVSTVCLLPQNVANCIYTLPLEEINMKLACSQFAPRVFAAGIIKFTDIIADITVLVFRSGKMVIVSCKTIDHARYSAQFIRIIIEQATGVRLTGRTVFDNFRIHNIVGHSDLGCKIDLQAMCDAAPSCCKWDPGMFPGLKCKIWLTEDHRCGCKGGSVSTAGSAGSRDALTDLIKRRVEGGPVATSLVKMIGKELKCVCVVKVLIFDLGRIVITGSKTIDNVNSVFYRIKQLAPRFETGKGDAVIPRADRFYHRLSRMMVPSGTTAKAVKTVARTEMKPDEAVALVIASTLAPGKKKTQATASSAGSGLSGLSALMRMAESNQLDNVLETLAMDPSQRDEVDANGLTALERMRRLPKNLRGNHYLAILEALKK